MSLADEVAAERRMVACSEAGCSILVDVSDVPLGATFMAFCQNHTHWESAQATYAAAHRDSEGKA